jgi:hypothetical protein
LLVNRDCAVFCSFEEEVAFAGVAAQGGGVFELNAGLVEAIEFGKKVAT